MQQEPPQKRIKERFVWEAMELVSEWRRIYKSEFRIDNSGRQSKYTLEQAAERVGCPRKTLEDYYYLLRKAGKLINLEEQKQQKMGFIRKLCKSKVPQAMEIKEEIADQFYGPQFMDD